MYVSDENQYHQLQQQQHQVLKTSFTATGFIDAWLSELPQPAIIDISAADGVHIRSTPNGLFGSIAVPVTADNTISEITREAYRQLFTAMQAYNEYTIIRFWNYVPAIVTPLGAEATVYHAFNEGRQAAFRQYYGHQLAQLPVPAASAVGAADNTLRIEWLAVAKPIAQIENKDQIPAYRYSEIYGKTAPFFSRGVIYDNNGQRILLSSGTASIKGEASLHAGDVHDQLCQSIHNLRILGSQFNLKQYNIHYGFALEDITALRVYYKHATDRAFLERFVPKFLSPSCTVSFMQADICREELLVELEAVFIKKGETEQGTIPKYILRNGRITAESFEIHVAEHCNLKCRDCCNISPFNAKKFISVEEVTGICAFVKENLLPDVFKVAGGEPTLHPQLDEILQVIKRSDAAKVVRVISNGLLMHRMTDVFWQHIDQLTISNYISAPVKPGLLEEIKQKARQYEVVLNIKYIDQFNEIFVDDAITDKARVQEIYDDCWMRHRCLIVRNGHFYKCTRAAYMNESLQIKGRSAAAGASTYTEEDGLSLTDPAFKEKALKYLNTGQPLLSCEYCLGVSGNLRENIQLKTVKAV